MKATLGKPTAALWAIVLLASPQLPPLSAFAQTPASELPERAPVPAERPEEEEPDDPPVEASDAPMPDHELACRARLGALGVAFEEVDPPAAEDGCSMPYPLMVSGLGDGVELLPEAVMNCATAEATARFVKDVVAPRAERMLGSPLATVGQSSAYVCRTRHGQERMSEHAFGNAIDLSAFVLEDGRAVEVREYGREEARERRFMAAIRRAACGPFTTVLGPGTDEAHADHFHFDLAERRSPYCR